MICDNCDAICDTDIVILHNKTQLCLTCHVKSLERFLLFARYWLKYKVSSEHGIAINKKIIQETEREIDTAKRKIRASAQHAKKQK